MKTLTFEFRNLPTRLIESIGSYTLPKWAKNMERDIKSEIDYHTTPSFTCENSIVTLVITVDESQVETLTCLLKNLHGAIIINS
jgi:hypothetical protein